MEAITKEELKVGIFTMPSDKALGPDGFMNAFFKSCWNIINVDIMLAIRFSDLHAFHFHCLNSADFALTPQKDGAEDISLSPH